MDNRETLKALVPSSAMAAAREIIATIHHSWQSVVDRGQTVGEADEAQLLHIASLISQHMQIPEWRPIESAPKDGARILVANLYEDGNCDMAFAGWYKGNNGFGRPMEGWVTDSDAADELGPAPSDWDFWMPLPAPPKGDEG